ncbi:MAG TPA: hypothetical protein VGL94_16645 [Ktedonobacteraceae bacterium]|jgi:hypothetical protein
MPRDIGPVIVMPGSDGDEYRRSQQRMKALKIEQAGRDRFLQQLYDTLRPGSPERRELELSIEKYRREIEKHAGSLKQSQTEWQKGTEEIIQNILKLTDHAAELYEPYMEYPVHDNFKDYKGDNAEAAKKRDYTLYLINQAIALYYRNVIQDLEKLKITDKPKFKEAEHFLHTLKSKMSERADLDRAATDCERLVGLAEFQIAHSRKCNDESAAHSTFIQQLPDGVGRETYPKRYWKAGNVAEYAKEADKRAEELESVLAYVEKHRQDTEAKIGLYLSQAQKRADAVNEATARENAVNRKFTQSGRGAVNEAGMRTANATNRVTALVLFRNQYKDSANLIITNGTNPAPIVARAAREARAAERRARVAGLRAQAAERRAQDAERRAQDAERRARIAKAYNDPQISEEVAKNVEKHARDSAKMEKEVASNAYLIQANEIKLQNELQSVAHNLRLMQLIQARTIRRGLTPEDRRKSLAELANKVEKAETAKNSAITFELQATEKEQTALENIRVSLEEEAAALVQERNNAQRITNLATAVTQDINVLGNLVNQQRALEETLRGTPARGATPARSGLIEREKAESQLLGQIEEAIRGRAASIATNKGEELAQRARVGRRRTEFRRELENVRVAEKAVAEALKRNDIHMERDVTSDANQAIECLQEIKDNLADQDDEGLKNRSQGHLFIDPKVGKFTINGVWMSVREVDKWNFSVPGQTTIDFRPDIVKIEDQLITRESGKQSVESVYTKRLSKRFYRSDNYEYTLEIPGDSFANGGRRQATLTIIDLQKRDGRIARPGGGMWTQAEYTTVEIIPMEATGKITIRQNHNNQNEPAEFLFGRDIEVMPNPVVDHAAALASKQGLGWSDEEKRRMCKLDLDRRVLILPNGQEYGIEKFDWTETKWDEDNGLSLQYKGPKELSQVNLLAASVDIFDERLLGATAALKKKKRKHVEDGIEWLKNAIKSYDEGKINDALGSLQSGEGIMSYQSSMASNELERPPKNRLEQERLKGKKKAQREALTPKWLAHSIKSTDAMFGARRGYENEVKKHIRAIHQHDSLSAKDVWKSRANPERDALIKHTSSKKKQELLEEIRAAEHLDKTLSFQLLEDPKQGPASPTSPVKNAVPNGLELLREYNLYKNKQDFANEIERHNVAQYLETIATEFRTNPDIDAYYTNQWYLEQAIAAANDGHFLSKEVGGKHIMGASEHIRNLKQVDRPSTSDSLADLRQADEYHWVTYLHQALTEANTEGMAELLQQALPVAKWMQESRYSNLKLAERALDPETPSEEANRMVDDMQTVKLWPNVDEKPTVAKDQKPDGKIDPKAITKKSDGELALDAGNTSKQIYKQAFDAIEHLINSTENPVLQRRYREKATEMVMDLAKQSFQINKQDRDIQNQWQKLEEYVKTMDSQRWKDLWKEMWMIWLKTSVESGSKGVQTFMSEFLKIVGKSIG